MDRKVVAFCIAGAALSALIAHSGLLFPATAWGTLGAAMFGGWLGFSIYRLLANPFE